MVPMPPEAAYAFGAGLLAGGAGIAVQGQVGGSAPLWTFAFALAGLACVLAGRILARTRPKEA
jgi:uncharacterized membrane protein